MTKIAAWVASDTKGARAAVGGVMKIVSRTLISNLAEKFCFHLAMQIWRPGAFSPVPNLQLSNRTSFTLLLPPGGGVGGGGWGGGAGGQFCQEKGKS